MEKMFKVIFEKEGKKECKEFETFEEAFMDMFQDFYWEHQFVCIDEFGIYEEVLENGEEYEVFEDEEDFRYKITLNRIEVKHGEEKYFWKLCYVNEKYSNR